MQLEDAMEMATALAQDISTIGAFYHQYQPNIPHIFHLVLCYTLRLSTIVNEHDYFICFFSVFSSKF